MPRWLRRLALTGLTVAGALAATCAGLFFVDPKVYTDYFKQQAISAARNRQINLTWGKSAFTVSGFTAYDFEASIPRRLLTVSAQRIALTPSYASLVGLAPLVSVEADLYGGKASTALLFGQDGQVLPRSIILEHLELRKHPQLAALGISAGTVTLLLRDIQGDSLDSLVAAGTFALRGLSKPNPTVLPPALIGIPLTIPVLHELSCTARLDLKPKLLSLEDINVNGTPGTMSGRTLFDRDQRGSFTTVSGEFKVELSSEGTALIGPYLPLVSNGRLAADIKNFTIIIGGTVKKPQVQYLER